MVMGGADQNIGGGTLVSITEGGGRGGVLTLIKWGGGARGGVWTTLAGDFFSPSLVLGWETRELDSS